MERRLRIRLIVSVFASLVVLLGLILVVSVETRRIQQEASADVYLNIILDNDGVFPKDASSSLEGEAEGILDARFFVVWLDPTGEMISSNLDQISTVSEDQAGSYAHLALVSGRDSGNLGNYRYLVREQPDGGRIMCGGIAVLEVFEGAGGGLLLVGGADGTPEDLDLPLHVETEHLLLHLVIL